MESPSPRSSENFFQSPNSPSDRSRRSSVQSLGESSQYSDPSSYGYDLYHELDSRIVKCDTAGATQAFSHSSFLPRDAVHELITPEVVNDQLRMLGDIENEIPLDQMVKKAGRVYAILALCGKESLISVLYREGLTDEVLPLTRLNGDNRNNVLVSANGAEFRSFHGARNNVAVRDFLQIQWLVLAPVFKTSGEDIRLDNSTTPLPFYDMKRISSNHRSIVYQGTLHRAHFVPKLEDDEKIVAIKDYNIDKEAFDKEKENLDRIQNLKNPHLIRHIATIQHGNFFYVVFPWADGGDLSDFWKCCPEVSQTWSPEFLMWCFQQMLGLVDALFALHDINCRHGDLKPENILLFKALTEFCDGRSEYGILVMADFGESKVHHLNTDLRTSGTNTNATTPCYEAPEAETDKDRPRGRRYDVWSVGCMFMEFAIWLWYGNDAIKAFRQRRGANGVQFPQKAPYYKLTRDAKADIHPVVSDGLEALKNDPRCAEGTALEGLVRLIAEDLIVIDPRKRPEAGELRKKLGEIVQKAKEDLVGGLEPPSMIPDPFKSVEAGDGKG